MSIHHGDIDAIVVSHSPLGRWEPRAKLLGVCPLIAVQACLTTAPAAAVALGLSIAVLVTARLPIGFALRQMTGFGLFVLPFVVLLPVLGSGPVIARPAGVPLHAAGLCAALTIAMRATGIFALTLVLLHSAPFSDTLWAAQSLGLPRPLVQIALLARRYVPILSAEHKATTTAARCRGFRPAPDAHTYRTTANVAAAILVRGHRRAERVWQAMACRGFAGRLYPIRQWRVTASDAAATAAAWAVSAGLLAGDLWLG